jgi:Chromo (CHRromatin Organisation MOdifier) domain
MNQTLKTYLRIFCSYDQDDWFDLLPLAEFAYNDSCQESTKMTPFFANYGYNPHFQSEILVAPEHAVLATVDFASHLQEIQELLIENIKRAQDYQARFYNAKHRPVSFEPGDIVWLNSTYISTSRPSKKLDWKRLGPFKIVKRIGLQAYRLALPPTMRHIHDIFHVSLLDSVKPTYLAPHGLPPAPPALYVKDDQEYFEIEDILDSKHEEHRLYYLIKWKGFPNSENSWEPLSNIPACGLVKEFHRRNSGKPGEPHRLHFVGLLR